MTEPADSSTPPSIASPSVLRWMTVVGVAGVALALVGFVVGIGHTSAPIRSVVRVDEQPDGPIEVAPSYQAIPNSNHSLNANWSSTFDSLKQSRPSLFEAVVRTADMKQAALVDRTRTRAFEGAPPVVPHPITQTSAASCLVCHGEGLQLGDRIATKVSHAHFTNCTQCHVEATSSGPLITEKIAPNEFAGVQRSGPGPRAMMGSPPQIPHTTWLREDCMSCHGLVTRPGLRTSHPWLSNCVQCHAPSAELDQRRLVQDAEEPRNEQTEEPVE